MSREPERPDPDALLAEIKGEEEPQRGRLRIWLGSAPGSGKTTSMLREGLRRKSRGKDVVIGFVELHGHTEIPEQFSDLEVVPPREVVRGDNLLREMDTDAVLVRRPKVALVDQLAHTNAPGSKNEKRYQDVQNLLDAGITVITTLNVENIQSLSDYVEQMTGIDVQETVPDCILDEAEQVELIDLPPDVLLQRMKDGYIYPPEQAQKALATSFTEANLTTLRGLALRATARQVEEKLDTFLHERKVEGVSIGERIMVAVDHRPTGKILIRRGWRLAAALKGELIVVHVEPAEGRRKSQGFEDEQRLEENLRQAEDLGAEVVHLRGSVSNELIAYARAHHVSQLFIGHPSHSRWAELVRGSVSSDVLRKARGIHIHVIGDRHEPDRTGTERSERAWDPKTS